MVDDQKLKEAIKEVISHDGYGLTVEVCRKAVAVKLGSSSDAFDGKAKHFRKVLEEALVEHIRYKPSVVEELRNPQINAGVSKRSGANSPSKPKRRSASSPAKKSSGTVSGKKRARPTKPKEEEGPKPPKKPLSGYFIYSAMIREEVKASNPGASVSEIAKIMGAKWNELDKDGDVMKQVNAKKEEQQKEYAVKLAAFEKEHGEVPKAKPRSKGHTVRGKAPARKKRRADDDFIADSDSDSSSDSTSSSSSGSDSESASGRSASRSSRSSGSSGSSSSSSSSSS